MSRGSLPPVEDDFARALLSSAEADAPSHAAYVKAAATLGLGVGLGVGASLPAAPAAVAVGAASIASAAPWSSTLGAKLALLGVSGALIAGAGALLLRSAEPTKASTRTERAPHAARTPSERALPAPATAPSNGSGSRLAARPLAGPAAAKSALPSEQVSASAVHPFVPVSPSAAPSSRRVAHASPSRVSSGSSLAEQVQSLDRARVALGGGDPASALREIARYRATWPDGVFVTEASVLEIEALAARGERSLAATRAAAFVAAHPDSPQADRLRALSR